MKEIRLMFRAIGVALTLGLLVITGCATSQSSEKEASTTGAHAHESGDMCPMKVTGTSVAAEEVEGGAGLRFTTTGDVAELQRRVTRMAEMHNSRRSGGGMSGMMHEGPGPSSEGEGESPDTGMHGEHGMMMGGAMMRAEVRAENLEDGAVLVFTPGESAELDELKQHLSKRVERMSSGGGCPMMAMHGGAKADDESGGDHESHHPPADE